ncbi:hypothetical protein [Gottfriedia solisilvae]|uniref:hypothetical protein n=1 Tax=Gottfriedia solisilvae TaxID=1516104 RepID=UPI003D2EC40B
MENESLWGLLTFLAIISGPIIFIGLIVASYFIGKKNGIKTPKAAMFKWNNMSFSKYEIVILIVILISLFIIGASFVGLLITISYIIGKSKNSNFNT